MRKLIALGVASAMIAGSPILAQGRSGSAGPPAGVGGGMGGGTGMGGQGMGVGNGSPITPPGLSGMNPRDAAAEIAAQKGQFGRDFAELQKRSPDELRAMAAGHRKTAEALAAAARAGANIPESAKERIRNALAMDVAALRAEFQIDRQEWQDMRNQWLTERGTMSARDWAMRRADWFAARDAWIAQQKTFAMTRR